MKPVFELCDVVRETGYAIHQYHGHGHLERVYENALAHRLRKQGLDVKQQHPVPVYDEDGTLIGDYFADLFVDHQLVVELKAARAINDEHIAQTIGYLKSAQVEHGLLISFGSYKFRIKKLVKSRTGIPGRKLLPLLFAFFAFLALFCGHPSAVGKPNILLILADDLGWSDLGCYGGEIATPHLDSLAKGGLQFRQFYNSARCSPSRASILTGLHPHQAGFPNLTGTLSKNAVTIPEVLKPAGYRSTMVGKWHLNAQNPPTARGFDEFYGMLGGYNSCWQEEPFYTRWPEGRAKRDYAKDRFYSTDVFADYAIEFIGDGKSGQPWFQYLAFNAPHFPLHAPEAGIAKYEAVYFEKGWDRIREERLARQKQLGLVPADLALTPRSIVPPNRYNAERGFAGKENPAWDALPEDRRRDLARRMAVYAAMVDRLDAAVGRVLAHLQTSGQFENTLIFFLSDNGACAEWDPFGFDKTTGPQNVLHTGDDLKTVGAPGSYISYGSGWAGACNAPWRLYKHYNHEGGIRTPCIVHWPAGLQARGFCEDAGYITDFMPTICEIAGAAYPAERGGVAILPQEGVSLVPAWKGAPLAQRRIFIEHEGNRSVRDGDWKLVALHDQPWELYQLTADPAEMHDLAAGEPARAQELAASWEAWADRCNVRIPTKP